MSDTSDKKKSVESAYLLMQYTHQNHKEVIGIKSFSGPYDFASVQYTIRVKPDESTSQAIKKIKEFLETQIKLIP